MPTPLSELLSMEELRGMGMDALKKRMLMQLLLQNPVAEGDADPTSPHYAGPDSSRPESRINRYVPGSRDPGMGRNPDLSPRRLSDMGELSPSLISLLESLKGK